MVFHQNRFYRFAVGQTIEVFYRIIHPGYKLFFNFHPRNYKFFCQFFPKCGWQAGHCGKGIRSAVQPSGDLFDPIGRQAELRERLFALSRRQGFDIDAFQTVTPQYAIAGGRICQPGFSSALRTKPGNEKTVGAVHVREQGYVCSRRLSRGRKAAVQRQHPRGKFGMRLQKARRHLFVFPAGSMCRSNTAARRRAAPSARSAQGCGTAALAGRRMTPDPYSGSPVCGGLPPSQNRARRTAPGQRRRAAAPGRAPKRPRRGTHDRHAESLRRCSIVRHFPGYISQESSAPRFSMRCAVVKLLPPGAAQTSATRSPGCVSSAAQQNCEAAS